jgi:NAD(P)-dependent dehydrogenase (short-subunit alcohol dehydrogenase family)
VQSSKTVIVTGASSGIGLALATAFVESGARVVANARRASQANALKPSSSLVVVDGDIASPDVAKRVVEAADQFGGVDLLVITLACSSPSRSPSSPPTKWRH